MKALADNEINVTQKQQLDLGMVENIVRNGENGDYIIKDKTLTLYQTTKF